MSFALFWGHTHVYLDALGAKFSRTRHHLPRLMSLKGTTGVAGVTSYSLHLCTFSFLSLMPPLANNPYVCLTTGLQC